MTGLSCLFSTHRRGTESAADTRVFTAGPTINASPAPGSPGEGNLVAFTNSGTVTVNGSTVSGVNTAIALYYGNHSCYWIDNNNVWHGPITASSGGSTIASQAITPFPPAAAIAASFTTLVLDAEFSSSSDVATSATQTTGAKLYWANGCTPSFTISGDVLTMNGWSGANYGQVLVTVPYNATSSVSTGCWQHGYFEANMQFNPVVQGTGNTGGIQEPSFWLKDVRNLTAGTYYFAECDIMEQYPNGTSGSSARTINTLHNWYDNNGSYTDEFNTNTTNYDSAHQADSNPHTYGCLWTGNGTTGQVSFYFDNVLCTHQSGAQYYALNTAGSPTSAFTAMENTKMFLNLNAAESGWPVVYAFVRVWQ